MTYDEFINKFSIDATYEDYTNNIEPLYTAADMDKYVFMCENYDNIIKGRNPYVDKDRHNVIYKIQFFNEADRRKFADNSIKDAFCNIRTVLKTCYNNHYINGEDITKLQLKITDYFRKFSTVKEFKPVAVLSNSDEVMQICLHDFYETKYYNVRLRKYFDYRSVFTRCGLRFTPVDSVKF